ncbi:MAG: bifunctional demethylmenaquinone methyltransferase/2-methoxy-6-polyprenyl-1,4-benzoquinol methylase UbiE [candidate division Zixibacteria bacterium]|nr:bifunctional demethylmenaquinone methyltransferase/2-methoxy-6-polyprenyl-1,4-benzoquinol methylase UbiE [candidate division Zixibacteria bacterium]
MSILANVQIRQMFSAVAPGYDRANDILSFGMHRLWRRRTVRSAHPRPGQQILDCATGTGDLALAFRKAVGPTGRVVGIDFSQRMINLAHAKADRTGLSAEFLVGDVTRLPFADGEFDIAAIGFGIRNVENPPAGIREMARVVKTGGKVVILEFGRPEGAIFGRLYRWYSRTIIPQIGGRITGSPAAYEYLERSAAAFPAGEEFVELMRQAAVFEPVEPILIMGQIAYIYVGTVG